MEAILETTQGFPGFVTACWTLARLSAMPCSVATVPMNKEVRCSRPSAKDQLCLQVLNGVCRHAVKYS